MIVTLAALACISFYLANIPMKFAIIWRSHPRMELRGGASIFEGRFALRRALKKTNGKKRSPLFLLNNPELLRPALHAVRYLMHHTELEYVSLSGIVSPPDAAATALFTGLGNMLHNACLPFGSRLRIHLQPDFSAVGSELELTGMISLRAGHIISAALIFALEYGKVRFEKWKADIRLKASCTPPLKTSAT